MDNLFLLLFISIILIVNNLVYCNLININNDINKLIYRGGASNNNNNNNYNLKFKNNKFKIAQFGDLHFGEGEGYPWGEEQDNNSTRVMNEILDKEGDIDLILFTGDLITGNNINGNASKYWEKAINVARERNVSWAITFGNHDDLSTGVNSSRYDLMQFDISLGSKSKLSNNKSVPGVSNYFLEIYDESNENVISLIWLFDSGDGENNCNGGGNFGGGYTCNTFITKEQIQWYHKESNQYSKKNGGHVLWQGAFFHIPLQEYMLSWNYDVCYGWNNDTIACQPYNAGLFEKFVELRQIKFVSVSHNHGNDFCSTLDHIRLCYGRHTGYGGYGNWERGARIIELTHQINTTNTKKSKVTYTTHITFETGEQLFIQPKHYPNTTQIPQTTCSS